MDDENIEKNIELAIALKQAELDKFVSYRQEKGNNIAQRKFFTKKIKELEKEIKALYTAKEEFKYN